MRNPLKDPRPNPIAIDLFCGLGGWTEGLISAGYDTIGFDIERHQYGDDKYPAQLVIQDVLTIHGSQFRGASLIVASPPCQAYSYMAMPWSRAKAMAAEYRSGVRSVDDLNALFNACFRIQREACEAAGRYIPMVVENVKGAQPWVGRAKAHFGSFYLWGDVEMVGDRVIAGGLRFDGVRAAKRGKKIPGQNWSKFINEGVPSPHWNMQAVKTVGHVNKRDGHSRTRHLTNQRESDGVKQAGLSGPAWFDQGAASVSSKSNSRNAASAQIAKIPFPLSSYVARAFNHGAEIIRRGGE